MDSWPTMALHIAEAGEHIAEAGEHIAKAGEAPSWTLPLPEMRVAHRVGAQQLRVY